MNDIVVIFDLDFTLIDNREGIINCFEYALDKFNIPQLDRKDIEAMIGTPLNEMFAQVTDIDPSKLASAFREHYTNEGITQGELIDGAKEKLKELKDASFTLGVVTSKKEEIARKFVEIHNLSSYFEFVYGETEDRKLGKSDPKLREILTNSYPNSSFIVIGDHIHDRNLSELLNSPFIGVLTGNHSYEQLIQGSKTKVLVFDNVSQITPFMIHSLF